MRVFDLARAVYDISMDAANNWRQFEYENDEDRARAPWDELPMDLQATFVAEVITLLEMDEPYCGTDFIDRIVAGCVKRLRPFLSGGVKVGSIH